MQFWNIFDPNFSSLILLSCLALCVLLMRTWCCQKKSFPPGPICLPIIGYVPVIFSPMRHIKLMQVGQKYGGIFSIRFGSNDVLVLNSWEAAKEVLAKPELNDRPDQELFILVTVRDPFFGNGPAHFEHKKFALRVFRSLNAGKALEDHVKIHINKLIEVLVDQAGKPYDARELLFATAVDVMLQVSFGDHLQLEDHERKLIQTVVSATMKMIERSTILMLFAWLKHLWITRKILRLDEFQELYDKGDQLLRGKMKILFHNENMDDCLMGHYIKEMQSKNRTGQSSTFSEEQLIEGIKILLAAASETTRDSLSWALYTVAVYKDTQRKIHREIDEFIGRDRMPSYSDQKNMRYTQAVLMEMQRWKAVVPLGIRVVSDDTNFGPYHVPKNTPVIINIWAIHNDLKYWKNPDDFIPERFLSDDEKHIQKRESYMPFSLGKRSCVGEGLAVMELFLFFTSILQKLEVTLPEGEKPNFEGFSSLSYQIKHCKLCYTPRDP